MRLTGAGGADEDDVRLGELDVGDMRRELRPLQVVVDGDGEHSLRAVLSNHPLVEPFFDVFRLGGTRGRTLWRRAIACAPFVREQLPADGDASVADIDIGSCDQLADSLARTAAE